MGKIKATDKKNGLLTESSDQTFTVIKPSFLKTVLTTIFLNQIGTTDLLVRILTSYSTAIKSFVPIVITGKSYDNSIVYSY